MTLIAVSRIVHGNADGSTKEFGIGDTVSGLNEDQERQLVEAGAVIETGKRKYTQAPQSGPVDEETRKRDEIMAKAAMGEDPSPAVTQAIASESSDASSEDGSNIAAASRKSSEAK